MVVAAPGVTGRFIATCSVRGGVEGLTRFGSRSHHHRAMQAISRGSAMATSATRKTAWFGLAVGPSLASVEFLGLRSGHERAKGSAG